MLLFKNFFVNFGILETAYLSYLSKQTYLVMRPNGQLFDPTSLEAFAIDAGVTLEPERIVP